jgi:hypothetical protein
MDRRPVTPSGDTRPHNLPAAVAQHRVDYWTWVENHADKRLRADLLELRDHWRECNERFFDGRMLEPHITLTHPSAPQRYGQCCPESSWGSRLEIRLRPSLLAGTHPAMKGGSHDGCMRLVKDILLHEMIHQHVMEHQPDVNENSYHGHGPVFTGHCNRISAQLGLPEVIVRNRGDKPEQPLSSTWPYGVAPPDRYFGVYERVTPSGDTDVESQPKPDKPTSRDFVPELVNVPASDEAQELWSPDITVTVTDDIGYEDLREWVVSTYRQADKQVRSDPETPRLVKYHGASFTDSTIRWTFAAWLDDLFDATFIRLDPYVLIAEMTSWLVAECGVDGTEMMHEIASAYCSWCIDLQEAIKEDAERQEAEA